MRPLTYGGRPPIDENLAGPYPDDADAARRRSWVRRERVRRHNARRLRFRRAWAPVALLGLAPLIWAATSFDPPALQTIKVALAVAMITPWMATFDLLGEAER
jgi:hypothetical protein